MGSARAYGSPPCGKRLRLSELSLGAVRAVDRDLLRLVGREVGAPAKRIVARSDLATLDADEGGPNYPLSHRGDRHATSEQAAPPKRSGNVRPTGGATKRSSRDDRLQSRDAALGRCGGPSAGGARGERAASPGFNSLLQDRVGGPERGGATSAGRCLAAARPPGERIGGAPTPPRSSQRSYFAEMIQGGHSRSWR